MGEDCAWLTVGRGEDRVAFRLYPRNRITQRPATAGSGAAARTANSSRRPTPADDLVLRIRDRAATPDRYRELKIPLDGQLPAIAAGLEAGVAGRAERRRVQAEIMARWAAAMPGRTGWCARGRRRPKCPCFRPA